jgi:Heavy metal associated domain 2
MTAMRHRAHIAHHTKGRLRVRVPSAKGNREALEEIRRALGSLTGVHEVTVNEATGSVIIHYDPNRHADFHSHLVGEGHHKTVMALPGPPRLTEIDDVAENLAREARYLSSRSETAKVLFDILRKCDLELKRATDNQIDLKVLAPLGLAVYAFFEMGFEAATPVWLTLGLFSFNHFVALHARHEMEAESRLRSGLVRGDPGTPPKHPA